MMGETSDWCAFEDDGMGVNPGGVGDDGDGVGVNEAAESDGVEGVGGVGMIDTGVWWRIGGDEGGIATGTGDGEIGAIGVFGDSEGVGVPGEKTDGAVEVRS